MVEVRCKDNYYGDIPEEYSILPIGFLLFHKNKRSGNILLKGANIKSQELLDLSIIDSLYLDIGSLNFDNTFYEMVLKVFSEEKSIEFISSIETHQEELFHCKLVPLKDLFVGCFFSYTLSSMKMNLESSHISEANIYQEQKSFKNLFHTFFHHVPVGIVLVDPAGRIQDVNNYFTKLFGYTIDEISYQNIDDFIVPEHLRDEGCRLTNMALNREVVNCQTIRKTKSNQYLHVLIQAAPIIQDQRQLGVFLIYQDFTSQNKALEQVKVTGQKLEELHKVVHQLDACNEEYQVYQVTVEAAANILKFDSSVIVTAEKEKLVPKVVSGRLSVEDFPVLPKDTGIVGMAYRSGKTFYCSNVQEFPNANHFRDDFRSVLTVPIGEFGVFQAVSIKEHAYNPEDVRLTELLIGHTEEVIKRILLKKQLYYQANYDALTGLINRHYFNQLLDREVCRARQYNYGLTFLMIDVDNFKMINDTLGHLAGDKVLREVAKLIKENVGDCDYVVRYGGDEFLVIMTEVDSVQKEEKVERVIERLRYSVKEWCAVQEAFLRSLSISIGAAHWEPDGKRSIKEVLYEADVWMYSDKRDTTNSSS